MQVLVELLKIGGVGALSLGIMFLLYRQLMKMSVFAKMTRTQTFTLLMTLTVIIFLSILTAFISAGGISFKGANVENSSGVVVQQ